MPTNSNRAGLTYITAVFQGATRKNNDADGNPRWIMHTDRGDLRTSPGAQLNHGMTNWTGGPGNRIGKTVTLWLDKAGRVSFCDLGGLE